MITMTKSLFFSELGAEAEKALRKVGHSILEVARMASIAPNVYRRLPTPATEPCPRPSRHQEDHRGLPGRRTRPR
ncbi:hypothetical protein ACFQ2B_38795 [Streptomyces stramineus]